MTYVHLRSSRGGGGTSSGLCIIVDTSGDSLYCESCTDSNVPFLTLSPGSTDDASDDTDPANLAAFSLVSSLELSS